MENDFISKDGKEYSAEEVLSAWTEKIDRSVQKNTDLAFRKRNEARRSDRYEQVLQGTNENGATDRENKPIFEFTENVSFEPEKIWFPLKERLTPSRFQFIA